MPGDQEFGAKPVIELDGAELPAAVLPLLEEVVVDDHLHLPDMFLLRFRDEGRDVITQAGLKIGSKVKISATAVGDGEQNPLIIGEITAFEAEYDKTGSHALVRGYDLSHRLCRTVRTRAFLDTTDSDIAREVATGAGMEIGRIDTTETIHEQVSQVRSTDWAFLKQRAEAIGFEVGVVLGKFEWRTRTPATDAPDEAGIEPRQPMQLSVGANLEWFRPRVTAAEQVADAKVIGWDPMAKEVLEASVPAVTDACVVGLAPAELARAFGGTEVVASARPRSTQIEVDVAAAALSERVSSVHAEAEGIAQGNPELRAGVPVAVALAGFPYDGKYTLTGTRHVYDPGGYRTQIQISGRQDRSLFALAGGPLAEDLNSRYYGVYPAVVTNNSDPERLSRVQLMVPGMSPDFQTTWARVAFLGAGPDRGASWIPEVGDEVLVAFEAGNPDHPYVVGGLWNGRDAPALRDTALGRGQVDQRGFVSRMGHRIVLDDGSDPGIVLQSSNGQLTISMEESGSTIKVDCATGDVEVTGINVKVEAQATLTLKAGALVEVSAAMIKLN